MRTISLTALIAAVSAQGAVLEPALSITPIVGTLAATCEAAGLVSVNVTNTNAAEIAALINATPAANGRAQVGAWYGNTYNVACLSALASAGSSSLALATVCASYAVCMTPQSMGYSTSIKFATATATATATSATTTSETTTTTSTTHLSETTTTTTDSTTKLIETTSTNITSPTAAPPALPAGSFWNAAGTYVYVNAVTGGLFTPSVICEFYNLRVAIIDNLSELNFSEAILEAYIVPTILKGTELPIVHGTCTGDFTVIGPKDFTPLYFKTITLNNPNAALCGGVDSSGKYQLITINDPPMNSIAKAASSCKLVSPVLPIGVIPADNSIASSVNYCESSIWAYPSSPFNFKCAVVSNTSGDISLTYYLTDANCGTGRRVICMP